MKDYSTYQAEDFAADEAFINWVVNPTPENSSHWQTWLVQNPQRQAALQEARALVLTLKIKPDLPSPQTMEAMWEHIEARRSRSSALPLFLFLVQHRRLAAVVAFLFVVGSGAGWFFTTPKVISTAYGETRMIELPDGSLVTLNGNTSLQYSRFWDNQKTREVWLEGEAFFHVRKKPQQGAFSNFVAHANATQITVLGTQFNVWNRRGETKIVLNEGKVQLQPRGSSEKPPITMLPGEIVIVKPNASVLISSTTQPDKYTAWTERKLVFNDDSLAEVARKLQETYGITIRFDDPSIGELKVKGEIYFTDLDTALGAIAETFNLTYTQTDQQVFFRRP